MQKAADIINALGGTVAVATALSLAPTTVSSWKSSNSIPKWRMPGVRLLAKDKGVELPAEAQAAQDVA
jgi:hypothetical protein